MKSSVKKTTTSSHRPLIALEPWIRGIPMEELLTFAKDVGFDGIEYMLTLRDLMFGPSRILALSKKHNMPIISLHQPLLLLINTPSFLFPRMLETAKLFPDVALINHHVSAFMFTKPSATSALLYKKMFENAGFVVSYESNPAKHMFSTLYAKPTYDAIAYQTFCNENQLPINLDVCHIASVGYDIVKFFSENYKNIRLIHLSDFKNGIQHLPIGEGELQIKELLQEIKHKKWDGNITFEIFRFPNQQSKKQKFFSLEKSLTFVHENLQ